MKSEDKVWVKFENHLLNEGLSLRRRYKYKQLYHTLLRFFGSKNLETLKRENLEDFVNALNRNSFKKVTGENYSGNTKSDIKKFVKYFWKYLKGNNEEYPVEVRWIKTRIAKDEKPIEKEVISINDAQKLANSFDRVEYKVLTLMLFDSGFRISEMLSVTKKDLTWEDYSGKQKCFWIKCNTSKTYIRKIPIPLFTEDIQQFVNGTYFKGLSDDNLLFKQKYRIVHKSLMEKSRIILKKDISPHLFRHSSATYWARELEGNTVALAQRYGWSLSAIELKTYVRMSGANEKASVKKVYENETVKLQERVEELENELTELKKTIAKQDIKRLIQEILKKEKIIT
jgi:integrase